jgi:hypothetical protein
MLQSLVLVVVLNWLYPVSPFLLPLPIPILLPNLWVSHHSQQDQQPRIYFLRVSPLKVYRRQSKNIMFLTNELPSAPFYYSVAYLCCPLPPPPPYSEVPLLYTNHYSDVHTECVTVDVSGISRGPPPSPPIK